MSSGALTVSDRDGACRFSVRVKPRASKTAVLGVKEDALEVSVSAPPVDGEANAELVAALAKVLGVPKRDVSVVSGESSRSKIIEVRRDAASVRARLAECLA